jgi:transposase
MFMDEARFGRIQDPRACWVPAPIRPNVGCQMIREYTYLYGAVSPKDGVADFLILPRMDSKCMKVFLKELSKRHKNEFLMIFWDGASNHKPAKLDVPANIMLETLPPYSPDLNPVENIWDDMRESFFHTLAFDSMDAVTDHLQVAALAYENNTERVHSITGWPWILSAL